MEQYYIKKGRRYVPVQPFFGFPSDGIFLVQHNGRNYRLILQLTGDPINVDRLKQYAQDYATVNEKVIQALSEICSKKSGVTIVEMAAEVTKSLLGEQDGIIAKGF